MATPGRPRPGDAGDGTDRERSGAAGAGADGVSGAGAEAETVSGDGAEAGGAGGAGNRDGGAEEGNGTEGRDDGPSDVSGGEGSGGGAPGVSGGEGSGGVSGGEGSGGGPSGVSGGESRGGRAPGAGAEAGDGVGAGVATGTGAGVGTGARRMPGVRLVQRVSSTRAFAKVAPHLIPALDRAVHRLTRGKVLLSAQMLPGIVLTARGARSGLERRTPLACMPEAGAARARDETGAEGVADGQDSGWILVGSNFGRTGHPAWTANLLAHPDAVISWRGEDIPVTARLLTGEERAAVWRTALAFWPPYATYQARVDREIRLFRIVRRGATATPDAVDGPPPA